MMAESKTNGDNGTFFKCSSCLEEIRDKTLLQALDKLWHIYCLRCCDCGEALEGKCFFREGNIYCEPDFYKRHGPKCCVCQQGIPPNQMVRKMLNKVFHITCLSCVSCKRQLSTGDLCYLLQDGGVICKQDYDDSKYSGESDPSSPTENLKNGKRTRTFIKTQQLNLLKSVYSQCPRPGLAERLRISKTTGLDLRVVQVWFQNRRAKERRLINRGKNPWINHLLKSGRHGSLSLPSSLDLSYSFAGSTPKVDNISEAEVSEDEVFTLQASHHNTFHKTGPDPQRQPTSFSTRPYSVAVRQVPSASVSPTVPDVVVGTRFPFPPCTNSFPPIQEITDVREKEMGLQIPKQPTCMQLSPTNSYYEADSEGGMSNINTPIEDGHFVFDGLPIEDGHFFFDGSFI